MAAQPLLVGPGPNLAGTVVCAIDQYPEILSLLAAISSCYDLQTDHIASGNPFRQIINELFLYTREAGDPQLQTQFITAVTISLLNCGTGPGPPSRFPKPDQVESIRRIIYQLGDLILLAKTGYGKSLVLQAVSVIRSSFITIQICPLNKLGEEQLGVIKGFPFANPYHINQSTPKVSNLLFHFEHK